MKSPRGAGPLRFRSQEEEGAEMSEKQPAEEEEKQDRVVPWKAREK